MSPSRADETLRIRKQLLLLESDLNRAALREEFAQIHRRTEWMRNFTAPSHGDRGGHWLTRLTPVAGLLATTPFIPGPAWLKRGLRFVQLAAAAYPIWKAFTSRIDPGQSGANSDGESERS